MPVLDNPRHERFAQLFARGEGAAKAYAAAGFRKRDAMLGAPSLLEDSSVCARIAELLDPLPERRIEVDLRDVEARIRALIVRYQQIQNLFSARAADPAMRNVAGGESGLLIRRYKKVGRVKLFVVEYVLDTNALRELRAIEQQIGRECRHSKPEDKAGPSVVPSFTEEEMAIIERLSSKLHVDKAA